MLGDEIKKKVTPKSLPHNTLSAGTIIKGDIVLDIDSRLDGHIEGNIKCGAKIVIGAQASVKGNIEAVNAEIAGILNGDLSISEKLILRSSAQVEGDIHTRILEIESDARFNGICRMTNKTEEEPKGE